MLIRMQSCLHMKVLAWYLNLNGVEKQLYCHVPIAYWYQKM